MKNTYSFLLFEKTLVIKHKQKILTNFTTNILFNLKYTFLLVLSFCFVISNYAQTDSAIQSPEKKSVQTSSIDSSKLKDLGDVYNSIFHKHTQAQKDSAHNAAKRYHFAFVPAVGYTLQTGFAAILSGNVGFYTPSNEQGKLSSITSSVAYSQYNQIIFPIQANIWTKNDKHNFIVDWRYLSYPSETFGLGGKTQPTDGYTINFSYIKLHQMYLTEIRKNMYVGLGYYFDYFWNITEVNPPAGQVTSFQKYGLTNTEQASGPAARFLFDSRLNQINPKNGFYASVTYHPNFTFLASDDDWASSVIDLRAYFKIPKRSNNILAVWQYDWLTLGAGKPPYLLLPSTGWDDSYNTGRGYIQGRFRGKNMVYNEAEYRFRITKNDFIGGVFFANTQTFSRGFEDTYQTIALAAGFGIRIKLNKHSGTNLCLDYGFGEQGSSGIFVNLGEVF
jgi:hypothetical protein